MSRVAKATCARRAAPRDELGDGALVALGVALLLAELILRCQVRIVVHQKFEFAIADIDEDVAEPAQNLRRARMIGRAVFVGSTLRHMADFDIRLRAVDGAAEIVREDPNGGIVVVGGDPEMVDLVSRGCRRSESPAARCRVRIPTVSFSSTVTNFLPSGPTPSSVTVRPCLAAVAAGRPSRAPCDGHPQNGVLPGRDRPARRVPPPIFQRRRKECCALRAVRRAAPSRGRRGSARRLHVARGQREIIHFISGHAYSPNIGLRRSMARSCFDGLSMRCVFRVNPGPSF